MDCSMPGFPVLPYSMFWKGFFPDQRLNLAPLHWERSLSHLGYQGSPLEPKSHVKRLYYALTSHLFSKVSDYICSSFAPHDKTLMRIAYMILSLLTQVLSQALNEKSVCKYIAPPLYASPKEGSNSFLYVGIHRLLFLSAPAFHL